MVSGTQQRSAASIMFLADIYKTFNRLEDWWRKVKTISERLTILTKRLFCRLWLSPSWWSPRWVSSALWFPPAPSLFWFENKGGTDGASAQRHPLVLVGGNVPGLRACTRGRDRKQGSRQWWQLRPGRPGSQAHSLWTASRWWGGHCGLF